MTPGSEPTAEPVQHVRGQSPSGLRFWGPVVLAVGGWLTYVISLELRNPRLIASWHGFLHSAITNRYPTSAWVPENPFFAGEPLRYYWFFHRLASGVARVLGLDPLSALRLLTLLGLVLLVVFAFLIGRRLCRSTSAGFLIGFLALVGLNPLGPATAAARHTARGVTLLETETGAPAVETVFTSNELADQFMARNLLGAMYLSTDWRHGNDIVWFWDISSRGLALAALMGLVLVLLPGGNRAARLTLTALSTAILTALNPIVGLAVGGILGFCLLLAGLLASRKESGRVSLPAASYLWPIAALALGVLLAAPTFYHLLAGGGGETSINSPGVIAAKLANLGINFIVLLPLALVATRVRLGAGAPAVRAMVLTALLLILMIVTVHLEEGNEHNLTNAAQVLLAMPAVIGLGFERTGEPRRNRGLVFGMVTALFLPVTAATWLAFDGRPALPFLAAKGTLLRTPADAPLPRLYKWIVGETGREAIFVVDPAEPVKMSGNVSELPAFTGRTLFTDQPSYLTTPYPDSEKRSAMARAMVKGDPLTSADSTYLWRLTHPENAPERPVYLITYHADREGVMSRLARQYGPSRFREGFVAVFAWPGVSDIINEIPGAGKGAVVP